MKITLLSGKTFNYSEALGFEIKIVKSATAKKLNLRIDERHRIPILTIPRFCSNRKALNFVEQHRDWIKNTLARLPQHQSFSNGSKISIAGQNYTILHNPSQHGIKLENNRLLIGGTPEFLHRRVCDFLKKYATTYLHNLSVSIAAKIGHHVHKVTVKETKSRWGSCSSKNNINYNWRIIMAPEFVINYLVSHEVSHLQHPNHSKEFWQCVENLCPNWQEGRHWLKIKGKDLYIWF